ncbi:RNA 2',3'-cyclic phosphodiesterase [Sphingomonas quercus]|uniref:RNA 2',3'-cyclic phosphodiesterase n=1 Tax=Sphingomonas quercus TaxID=2842451 RepID=A0ABS6BGF4_9SPHN|nr:RNA 2',3'-cyclic phosphodiesterase [Sphingomonas quercus]MBU3077254.1 RNA 2',3'-cyclic phosphodiesterase [Sphingomonas quercus]
MHRLFVAIQPPRPIRARLLALMGGIIGARWQSDAQLHLTLRFIGELDRHRAEDAAAALGTVHHAPIAVTLEGIGQFDRRGRIDSLWIGARPQAALTQLHNKIDQALVRVGLEPEGRAYLPHVTLARFGAHAGDIGGFVASAGATIGPFDAEDFCLYESHLGTDGAAYEVVARYPLA